MGFFKSISWYDDVFTYLRRKQKSEERDMTKIETTYSGVSQHTKMKTGSL